MKIIYNGKTQSMDNVHDFIGNIITDAVNEP